MFGTEKVKLLPKPATFSTRWSNDMASDARLDWRMVMKNDDLRATCKTCGFTGHPFEFDAALCCYHDLACPRCRSRDIDTSACNYEGYAYGDDNTLIVEKNTEEGEKSND